ncbi:MAG: 50S ribosomal protein L29, partial [Candidatus Helarchaeales archaeon]
IKKRVMIMAILRMKEIRKMTPEERMKKLNELRNELSKQRALISSGGALENPCKARVLKKTIARILTVQNEERLQKT